MIPSCHVCGKPIPEAAALAGSGVPLCSTTCETIFSLRQRAGALHESDRRRNDGDEGYDGESRPCIACDTETVLRCSTCRQPVCERCPECPNGCDGLTPAP